MFDRFMKKLVAWLDPKLEPYRPHVKAKAYTPATLADFIKLLQRTPRTILSDQDRDKISAIMSFSSRRVESLMVKKSAMVFVSDKDFLGPLMLDRLYKSGFTHFPVVDRNDHVLGVIHTEALNALEIKKTDKASKYLDKNIHCLHVSDTLDFVVEEFRRTNCFYFLVLNEREELAGFFTIDMLLSYLLG